ncbi:hypothetical protein SynMVIR181_00963 [Synechococcus sp. MVIR-18-1]|nr:hypothetical protein SynMVIR181_00963 [Synechococcus sp. MVIR-18-1]
MLVFEPVADLSICFWPIKNPHLAARVETGDQRMISRDQA